MRIAPDCSSAPPRAGSGWRTHLYIAVIALVIAVGASAQGPDRDLLNSQRIAAAFGSYGVEVLEQDERLRAANLFSGQGAAKVCRTFAVVRYAARVDPAIGREHAAIVAGGSIGAVFAAQGWEVRKTHLHYGERTASAKLATLMRVDPGTPLAEHVYVLDVVKDGRTIEYAALVEIHHPDYLALADLARIYGSVDEGSRADVVEALLREAGERAR